MKDETETPRPMPKWFPEALAAAQHADAISSWPWYGRLLHKLFISWRCPACQYKGTDIK